MSSIMGNAFLNTNDTISAKSIFLKQLESERILYPKRL